MAGGRGEIPGLPPLYETLGEVVHVSLCVLWDLTLLTDKEMQHEQKLKYSTNVIKQCEMYHSIN